jgi:hypothetical protein
MRGVGMAGKKNFIIEQGATFSKVITWKDKTGALVNLTGFSARMHIRSTVDATTTILELTTANSRIALGGAAGTITLTVSATDTAALTDEEGVYDLELVSGGGVVTRLLEGSVQITKEVTR